MSSCISGNESVGWTSFEASSSDTWVTVQDTNTRCANPEIQFQPSKSILTPVCETLWRWKRENDSGWWRLHSEPRDKFRDSCNQNWEGLQFKLTVQKENELQRKYPPAGQSAFDYKHIASGLQDILEDVTSLRICSKPRIGVLLPNVLDMVKSPTPVLEQLVLRGSGKNNSVEYLPILMDAAKSGKLSRLNHVGFSDDGEVIPLEFLADLIRTGGCSSLSGLYLFLNNFGYTGMKSLAESLHFVGGLRCLSIYDHRTMQESDHVALAQAMESGSLLKLERLSLIGTALKNADRHWPAYRNALKSGNLPALKEIKFLDCGISDEGAEALADGFSSAKLTNLVVIRLAENPVREKGMKSLATALEVGGLAKLTELDLSFSTSFDAVVVGGSAMGSLAQAIQSGKLVSLRILKLPIFSDDAMEVLLGALLSPNSPKVTEVRMNGQKQFGFGSLNNKLEQILEKNRTYVRLMAELGDRLVPATFGKVYLCGDPMVGKSTLRKSLERSFLRSLITWETKLQSVERTRGIDVSLLRNERRQCKGSISLALWDMAGQNEYHVIHNSFFPDLGPQEGKATTFLVVCRSDDMKKSERELDYWLKFISSSLNKGIHSPRDVCVVVNRIDGDFDIRRNGTQWTDMVVRARKKFNGVLNISPSPFFADVRKRKAVGVVKQHLMQRSQAMLKNKMVPEICHFLQKNLYVWIKDRENFPLIPWSSFLDLVRKTGGAQWPEKTVKAAVEYLNESGVLIYIDKEFPAEWAVPHRVLVVLDPNWFCRDIVGHMFLPVEMLRAEEHPFRDNVDPHTGSIPITLFKSCLQDLTKGKDVSGFEDLIIVFLWLGLCYKGRNENLFIPSLAGEDPAHRDSWDPRHGDCWAPNQAQQLLYGNGQWVMGYSVGHSRTEIALAPIALWHRFQVELAQTPKFNGQVGDNDFVSGKYFVSFKIEHMAVLIKVHVGLERPTFEHIDILVKPLLEEDNEVEDLNARKQCQVDLGNELAETLMTLWTQWCPGIDYVQRIVWPYPASGQRPKIGQNVLDRNVEVAQVRKWVQMHGVGRKMNWDVGGVIITEDQLLSTKEKNFFVRSLQNSIIAGKGGMMEAIKLRILPEALLDEAPFQEMRCFMKEEASTSTSQDVGGTMSQEVNPAYRAIFEMLATIELKVDIVRDIGEKNLKLSEMNLKGSQELSKRLKTLMTTKKILVQKVQEVGRFFLEDKEGCCPRYIYLGTKKGAWMTLKAAMSPTESVHLHFFCEARYNDYMQHPVKDQLGIKVSHLKQWAQKIAPWLRLSLTILYISAKLTANVIAPGMGLILPDCSQWQAVSSLSEGIQSATGYSQEELNKWMEGKVSPNQTSSIHSVQELHGSSRHTVSKMLGKLTAEEFEEKVGLRKVHLRNYDASSHGVVWICNDCFKKYRSENLVTEL